MDGGRTVAELAAELNLEVREVVALCTVAGVRVRDGSSRLRERDVRRVHDVLDGRIPMPDPQAVGTDASRGPRGVGRWIVVVGGIGLVAILVFGATRAYDWIERPSSIDVRSGDCFENPGLFAATIEPVPCDEPHAYRAFATLDLSEVFDEWPGESAIEDHAADRCSALAPQQSDPDVLFVQIFYFGPNERGWRDEAARRVVCALAD